MTQLFTAVTPGQLTLLLCLCGEVLVILHQVLLIIFTVVFAELAPGLLLVRLPATPPYGAAPVGLVRPTGPVKILVVFEFHIAIFTCFVLGYSLAFNIAQADYFHFEAIFLLGGHT